MRVNDALRYVTASRVLTSSKAPVPKWLVGRLAAVCIAVATSSCGRAGDRAANDTGDAPDSLRIDTTAVAPTFREWTAAAGRYLLVAAGSLDSAQIVFPEFTLDSSLTNAEFAMGSGALVDYELFGPDGSVSIGRLSSLTKPVHTSCETWPRAVILPSGELRGWTIGLQAGRAHGVPYTSLDRLSGSDSSGLAIILTRLASQAPNDTIAAVRGLQYVVRSAYTAMIADSITFVFGELVRRVNIEASPHEERTTIIGEKAPRSAAYVLAFSERHTGDEESVPTTDLLGLMVLRDSAHAAFATRDYSDGGTYLMFERRAGPRWRLRWNSAYAGC